jgi:hypothetical protein
MGKIKQHIFPRCLIFLEIFAQAFARSKSGQESLIIEESKNPQSK